MTYLSNIENAKAVPAPRELTKDVVYGRYLAAMIELDKFEKRAQEDKARIEALLLEQDDQANYITSLEATIEEQAATIRHKDNALFNAHSRRAQLERKLDSTRGEEHTEFPKGTGRIYALREMSQRFPGCVLKGDTFVLNGEVVGTLP